LETRLLILLRLCSTAGAELLASRFWGWNHYCLFRVINLPKVQIVTGFGVWGQVFSPWCKQLYFWIVSFVFKGQGRPCCSLFNAFLVQYGFKGELFSYWKTARNQQNILVLVLESWGMKSGDSQLPVFIKSMVLNVKCEFRNLLAPLRIPQF
jgi:hypothetical protein